LDWKFGSLPLRHPTVYSTARLSPWFIYLTPPRRRSYNGRQTEHRLCETLLAYRILSIAPTSFFSDYGAHVRILEEIIHLQRRGHEVVLCTYHIGSDVPGVDIRRSIDVPWKRGVMVGSSRHKLYFDVALAATVQRTAVEFKPDLVHAHIHEGALLGWTVRQTRGVPLVFDYQGSMTAEMLDHRFIRQGSPLLGPLRWLEHRLDRAADAVITSTHNAEHALREAIGDRTDRITTVPDAVNTQVFAPPGSAVEKRASAALKASMGIPAERKVVAYLGLLAPYQGTDRLLEAASIVVNEWGRRDIHFLVMGFPGVDTYRDQADRLGLNGLVTFPGRIPYVDAPRYLAVGDVGVAPKLSATEGAGKIGNYMAMGMPVVAFDMPVSHEYMGDLGVYAMRGNPRSLAEKLCEVLDNPEHYRHVGEQLRARCIAQLSWSSAIVEIEQVYADAITRRAGQTAREGRAARDIEQVKEAVNGAHDGDSGAEAEAAAYKSTALPRAGLEADRKAGRAARYERPVDEVAEAASRRPGTVRP
jgi:glycosyltransferase involved in cell wall biosynthesis